MAVYVPNRPKFALFMKSGDMTQVVYDKAQELAAEMRATAPRGQGESAGHYARSFQVEFGLDRQEGDRSAAFIVNTARYAAALEFGSWNIHNPPRPMTRVLQGLGGV